jgi:DNA-binding response OmpR family regulator
MSSLHHTVIFVDNTINRIFKTIDLLKSIYKNVIICKTESELFETIEKDAVDVIFLNLDLQPNDAVTILKELRLKQILSNPLIVIYSDKQDDFVQEIAYNSGVDAFINFQNKPSVMELYIKNILRRRVNVEVQNKRAILIDKEKYLIFKNGEAIQLPRKEFILFELLYNQTEKFLSKKEIAFSIWGDESIANKRTIDVHVYNIRQFFGKRIIQSQKGKGYRMNKKLIA